MEYTYLIIEHTDHPKEIQFTSLVPLRSGEQIQIDNIKYEVTIIRYIAVQKNQMAGRAMVPVKNSYYTNDMQAHVRKVNG